MKHITLIIGLLVVGCGKQEQTDTNESTPTTTAKPAKELSLEEKAAGTYEFKEDGDTYRMVSLENSVLEGYKNGKKLEEECKWKAVDGEMHVTSPKGKIIVYRINKGGSITAVAVLSREGEREEAPKEEQITAKKIK